MVTRQADGAGYFDSDKKNVQISSDEHYIEVQIFNLKTS